MGDVMISQTTDYALRAVVALAQNTPQSLTTEQIAEKTKVPRGYLSKVLQQLVKHGIIESRRGVRGGYTLSSAPNEMTLLPIINAIEPIKRISDCPLKLASHKQRCPLHQAMDEAALAMEKVIASKTISDLLADDTRPVPFCESEGCGKTVDA